MNWPALVAPVAQETRLGNSVEMLKHLLAMVFEECLNKSLQSMNTAG